MTRQDLRAEMYRISELLDIAATDAEWSDIIASLDAAADAARLLWADGLQEGDGYGTAVCDSGTVPEQVSDRGHGDGRKHE